MDTTASYCYFPTGFSNTLNRTLAWTRLGCAPTCMQPGQGMCSSNSPYPPHVPPEDTALAELPQ
eukprot:6217470-Alexandrium_andersonii.AAC.1